MEGWQTVTKRKGKNKDIPINSEIMIRSGSNTNENINGPGGSTSQAHSTKQERNQITSAHKIGISEEKYEYHHLRHPIRPTPTYSTTNSSPPLFGLNHKLFSGETSKKNEDKEHPTLNGVLDPLQSTD